MNVVRSPAWVSLIWLGMTAGVFLLAMPVRFSANTITQPVALDVSRVVFAALNKTEFAALIVLLITVRVSGHIRELLLPAILLTLILLIQATWLLPELALLTDQVVSGIKPAASNARSVYSVLELTKLFLLVYVGFRSLQLLEYK